MVAKIQKDQLTRTKFIAWKHHRVYRQTMTTDS
jgi:hypothetical protein